VQRVEKALERPAVDADSRDRAHYRERRYDCGLRTITPRLSDI
jgi:hypothetical protein